MEFICILYCTDATTIKIVKMASSARSSDDADREILSTNEEDEPGPGEDEGGSTPKKKRKRMQTWHDRYLKLEGCVGIEKSKSSVYKAHCRYCKKDFSIAASGAYDITRHCSTSQTHKDAVKAAKRNATMNDFLVTGGMNDIDKAVIRAEAMYTDLIVELNLPLAVADRFTKTHAKAFPDSKIAQRYQCGRDKTTAIVKFQGKREACDVVSEMKTGPFCMATDGSSDQHSKQYPLVVTSFDMENGVKNRLLGVPCLATQEKSTGVNIAGLVKKAVQSNSVPWAHCIGFGSDNAPVMTGHRNGVIAELRKEHPDIYMAGCPIHLIHIAAEKGAGQLPFVPTGLPVGDVIIDTYSYFSHSSNRLGNLQQWQDFYDIEHQNILKHGKTRWLSLGPCLDRVLGNWEALKQLFREAAAALPENASNECREKRLFTFYRSPTNKLLCLFLQNTIKIFEGINTRLQRQAPQIHVLRRDLHKFVRDLLLRFKTPGALRGRTVTDVNVDTDLGLRPDVEMIIGDVARGFIERKDEVGLRDNRIKEAYAGMRKFFIEAVKYAKQKLPMNDELLCHAEIADVFLRTNAVTTHDLRYFLKRFPALLPQGVSAETIELEFAEFQAEDDSSIPTDVEEMDKVWSKIATLKDSAGVFKYLNLACVMLGILCIPHSNAQCERMFSMIRHNKTWQRGSLGDATVEAIMLTKSRDGQAHTRKYSDGTLKGIKSAYYQYLKK